MFRIVGIIGSVGISGHANLGHANLSNEQLVMMAGIAVESRILNSPTISDITDNIAV